MTIIYKMRNCLDFRIVIAWILKFGVSLFLILGLPSWIFAQLGWDQKNINEILDSFYISKIEDDKQQVKVLHAEPLYIDLIRDLGARKGEKEWNVGLGLTDNEKYDEYLALVEYEWAPIDRLGLEVELPFSLFYNTNGERDNPGSRLNSLKLAAQYTFLVSDKAKTSMALGYLHEFELAAFKDYGEERLYEGNIFNPFFVVAKRWGQNYHTLLYAGPEFLQAFRKDKSTVNWQINSNFHYMIPGTRNFIGVEFNKEITRGDFDMIIRPQMRLALTEKLMVGIVTGIPFQREDERFSSFIRLIYEPGHH
jgi:hypothetical protein